MPAMRYRRPRPGRHQRVVLVFLFVASSAAGGAAGAGTAQELLASYEAQARVEFAGFRGFSAEEGRAFYFERHPLPVVGEVGCVSCHLGDPRRSVMRHRTKILCRACHVIHDSEHVDPENAKKREIGAFAPVANPRRFTDPDVVEKWFKLNCGYLLGRSCTVIEKGNLLFWLLSLGRGEQDGKPDLAKDYDWLVTD
jgi:hypothetical protein